MPKDSYSKKQWKNTNELIKSLDSIMCLENVKKISDEELFKQRPPNDDCPICFLPTIDTGSK